MFSWSEGALLIVSQERWTMVCTETISEQVRAFVVLARWSKLSLVYIDEKYD